MREYASSIIPTAQGKIKPCACIAACFELTFMRGIGTLLGMEQPDNSYKEALSNGQRLTISLDRDALKALSARGEIAVYDDRFTENPSFRIFDSYRIRKNSVKCEVLRAMLAYNQAHPSEPAWQRTEGSLLFEWLMHNFAYRVGFLRSRAGDVDLDNRAEGKGSLGYFLQSAFEVIRDYFTLKRR
jgi:hypothetical protein